MKLSAKEVADTIINVVKRHQPASHYRLFYFGSRVTGKGTPRSDFDVGLEADQPIPAEKFIAIQEELEDIPILQKIDFVDFSTVSEEFKKQAQKNMKIIYEQ